MNNPRQLRDERGSIVLYFAIVTAALMLVVGFVVDGAGRIRATQQADQVAREAARQAGQALDVQAVRGAGVNVNPAAGRAAALSYLAAAGVTGDVTFSGSTVRVRTEVAYTPLFLPLGGSVIGQGEARTVRVLTGAER